MSGAMTWMQCSTMALGLLATSGSHGWTSEMRIECSRRCWPCQTRLLRRREIMSWSAINRQAKTLPPSSANRDGNLPYHRIASMGFGDPNIAVVAKELRTNGIPCLVAGSRAQYFFVPLGYAKEAIQVIRECAARGIDVSLVDQVQAE